MNSLKNYNIKKSQNYNDVLLEEMNNIKYDISSLKNNIENNINTNISSIKKEMISMNNQIKDIKNLLLKFLPSNNLNNNNDDFNNMKSEQKIVSKRSVTISMNNKDFLITVNNNITFEEFKSVAENYFKILILDNISIHYFNTFGVKKYILNEYDFKNTLIEKVFKYYFNDKSVKNKTKFNLFQLNKQKQKDDYLLISNNTNKIINNTKIKEDYKNISKSPEIVFNKNKKSKENDIEKAKIEAKEVKDHFCSIAFQKGEVKIDDYINSAVYVSDLMKKININEKKNHPEKLVNPKKILKYPGLISDTCNKENNNFILSLIYKILKEKGINTLIYNKKEEMDKMDGVSLQYLFSGLTEKKKLELVFDLGNKTNKKLLQKGKELINFISEWKIKLSQKLNTDVNDIILVNPKEKNGLCSLDLLHNKSNANSTINKIKSFNEIKNIEEKPLIEACQLDMDIFDPAGNNQDGGWGFGEKRGGEDYLPPIGWNGYGLKVRGKYDYGDDTWLNFMDKDGVFAVAYFGLSNIYGNKNNLNHFFNEIFSEKALKIGYEQTYSNDKDLRNPSKKCGNGVYLFQDPKIAENTAGIIDIDGVRYKILLMCRKKKKKIRQPEGFKDCWILNPSSFEIRPYMILVKKIFQSPLAGSSQNEIITFKEIPEFFKEIINNKDTCIYKKNKGVFNDDDFVINLYSSNDYIYINNYLRSGKMNYNVCGPYTEKEIKSWVWCLHKSLTKRKSNVPNNTIVYRGVNRKLNEQLGVGTKIIFCEFISTSIDINVAKGFCGNGTLFIIRIENNINPNFYCYKIEDLSCFPNEKEILITSNCTFQITSKINANKNNEGNYDLVYLTCYGYQSEKNIIFNYNNIFK